MGSRQQDAYKMHMKAVKRKMRKKQETFGNPYLDDNYSLIVANPLDLSKRVKTEVFEKVSKSKRDVIKSIVCPTCGYSGRAYWNSHWEAFICEKCEAKWEIIR